jgi:hypothetical protein
MPDTPVIDDVDLAALRAAYRDVQAPSRPPLTMILSRARARQLRRRGGIAITAAAGIAAVALAFGSTATAPTHSAVEAGGHNTPLFAARTAAYTIVSRPDGTATLTITPSKLFDPTTLQRDLARAGVPAIVTMGTFCTSDPAPAGFGQAVTFVVQNNGGPNDPDAGGSSTITIHPDAIPAQAALSVGDVSVPDAAYPGIRLVSMTLVDKDTYSCSATARPDSPSDSDTGQLRFVGIPTR